MRFFRLSFFRSQSLNKCLLKYTDTGVLAPSFWLEFALSMHSHTREWRGFRDFFFLVGSQFSINTRHATSISGQMKPVLLVANWLNVSVMPIAAEMNITLQVCHSAVSEIVEACGSNQIFPNTNTVKAG